MAVCYLGQEVLRRKIQGADIRIMYLPSSPIPPTPAAIRGGFTRILLPDPPSSLPTEHELFNLLPFMQQGVLLTSMTQGVYGKRFCQGRVFWTGPHTTSPGPHKMERNTEPLLLFSKDVFRQGEGCLGAPAEPTGPGFNLLLSCVSRTGLLPFKRRRAASVWHHAVLRRRAERRRRPVCQAHHPEGEGSPVVRDSSSGADVGLTSLLFPACFPQITFPWAEQQVREAASIMDPIAIFQSLAGQSPLGEITLNLVTVAAEDAELIG